MEQNDEITLKEVIGIIREYRQYLLSKWKTIFVAGIVGAVVGLSISIYTTPKYIATLKFIVDEGNSSSGLISLANNLGLGNATNGEQSLFSTTNIIEFLKTRTMIEATLLRPIPERKNTTYAELYIDEYNLRKDWQDKDELKNIHYKTGEQRQGFSRAKDSILGEIYTRIIEDHLSVQQTSKDNSFIEASVTSQNELFSKNFAIELIDVASEYYIKSKTQKAHTTVAVLQHQVDSVSRNLYKSMGGAAFSLDQVFGLNPAMNAQKIGSAKEEAQAQMSLAMLQELVKNLEISKIDLLNNTPVITVVESPIYPLSLKEISLTKGLFIGYVLATFLMMFYWIIKKYLNSII